MLFIEACVIAWLTWRNRGAESFARDAAVALGTMIRAQPRCHAVAYNRCHAAGHPFRAPNLDVAFGNRVLAFLVMVD